jgi:hypothetical protein
VSTRVRRLLAIGGILGIMLFARQSGAELLVTFQAPHIARASAATLTPELSGAIDARIDDAQIGSLDQLLHVSLDVTGADLHFGLAHRTTLRFGTKEREGNCIEYAHLFALVFNRGAEKRHVAARAYVVHSDARVLGKKLAMRGLGDHEWVLVVPSDPVAPRRFVDPTFHDLGLGWDIARSVLGAVRVP